MKNILVTGSSGFIGSALCVRLEKSGYKVTGLSKKINIKKRSYEQISGDITNKKLIKKLLPNVDVVIHLAAYSDVKNSFNNLDDIFRINIEGTFNILKNISYLNRKPYFIFVSSSTVYGNCVLSPIKETSILNPTTPFGMSKDVCEEMCKGFANSYDMPITIVRPFTVYGPNAPTHQLIPRIIKQIRRQNDVIYIDNPGEIRDFIFIDDLIDAFIHIVKKPSKHLMIYNVGSGKGYKVGTIVERIIKLSPNRDVKIKTSALTDMNKKNTVAEISLIRKETKWKPRVTLNDGLTKTLNSFGIVTL